MKLSRSRLMRVTGIKRDSFVISIAPTVGSNAIVNGDFSSWTGGNPDEFTIATPGSSAITQVDSANTHGGGGTGAMNIFSSGGVPTATVPTVLVKDTFYRHSVNVTARAGGYSVVGGQTHPFYFVQGGTGIWNSIGFAMTDGNFVAQSFGGSGDDVTIDDLSLLPLSNIYGPRVVGPADWSIDATSATVANASAIGFICNADGYPTFNNGIMVLSYKYLNYTSRTGYYSRYMILKKVAGTWSVILNPVDSSGGLKIQKIGSLLDLSNSIRRNVKTVTISDAGIVNNTNFFQFSTDATNVFGTIKTKIITGKYKILAIGDSKTSGVGSTDSNGFFTYFTNKIDFPSRFAQPSVNANGIKLLTDAQMTSYGASTPDAVIINIGINDAGVTLQASFESDLTYILDAIHTKWASVPCYLMRVWSGSKSGAPCDNVNTWIGNVISSRNTFAYAGPDERTFLPGKTADGTHPNDAGYAETAAQWNSVLGF